MLNKPDWKNAPSWANYLAMDSDGTWYWYEKGVKRDNYSWSRMNDSGKCQVAEVEEIINWEDTLEEKP